MSISIVPGMTGLYMDPPRRQTNNLIFMEAFVVPDVKPVIQKDSTIKFKRSFYELLHLGALMSKTWKRNDRGQTALNRALKADNKSYRHTVRQFTKSLTADPDKYEEVPVPLLREHSNPWDYD